VVSSLQVSQLIFFTRFRCFLCALQILLNVIILIQTTKSTNYEAPRYVTSFRELFLLSYVHTLSSESFPQTHSVHVFTKFQIHAKFLLISIFYNNVTRIPLARQRLGKHILEKAYERNNRTSIARQRTSQHAYLKTEAVFCVVRAKWLYRSVRQHRTEQNSSRVVAWNEESSFETPACQDMSLGAEELNWVESSELAVAE
jgi:hypothetical protein